MTPVPGALRTPCPSRMAPPRAGRPRAGRQEVPAAAAQRSMCWLLGRAGASGCAGLAGQPDMPGQLATARAGRSFSCFCRPVVVLNKVDRPGATEQRCGEVESCEAWRWERGPRQPACLPACLQGCAGAAHAMLFRSTTRFLPSSVAPPPHPKPHPMKPLPPSALRFPSASHHSFLPSCPRHRIPPTHVVCLQPCLTCLLTWAPTTTS